MLSIALTGHRPQRLDGYNLTTPFYDSLSRELLSICLDALDAGPDTLTMHSGMAQGADTIWAQAAVVLQRRFPGRVRFAAHVPCASQPDRWPAAAQARYRALLAQADETHIYADAYSPQAMHLRNVGLVDACDALVAVYDGSPKGGTADAVRYAQASRKPVTVLHPDLFRG